MMKKQNKQASVLVYMKNMHKYSKSEQQLAVLCKSKYQGRYVGGGTDLSTGKRDQQFVFKNMQNARSFLQDAFVRAITLKKYDLLECA